MARQIDGRMTEMEMRGRDSMISTDFHILFPPNRWYAGTGRTDNIITSLNSSVLSDSIFLQFVSRGASSLTSDYSQTTERKQENRK